VGDPKVNRLRKSESSSLQLSLPFETSETTTKESDTDESLKKLDEVDLMALIYELKYNRRFLDEAYLNAAERELEKRKASPS
jgi:hypothetical protein